MENKLNKGLTFTTLTDKDLNFNINLTHKCSNSLDINIIKDEVSDYILNKLKNHIMNNFTITNNEPIENSIELNIKLNLEILK